MKYRFILLSLLFSIVSFGLGTFYGWRSGYTDGMVESRIELTRWLPKTRSLSRNEEVNKQLDILAASSASVFASGYSYSPFMYFLHPKADGGLMDMLLYHDVFESQIGDKEFFIVASLTPLGANGKLTAQEIQEKSDSLRQNYKPYLEAGKKRFTEMSNTVEQGAAANP